MPAVETMPETAAPAGTTALARWRDYLLAPVDGASLAVFRICFGLLMACELGRYLALGWVAGQYAGPSFHFTYALFPFVRPWPGGGMYWHFAGLGACAVLMAVGLFYRAAAWGFFLGFTYVFLLDEACYLNHFYLVCLVSFLLAVMPAHSAWSVDAWLRPGRHGGTVPRWCVLLLRAQVTLVYFYAGVAKLNGDWLLRGEPLRAWLEARSGWPLAGLVLRVPGGVAAMAWGGCAFDLAVGFLLWGRRTFLPAALAALAFHMANAHLFYIGVFPWLMVATLALFPPPDWPRRRPRAPAPPRAGRPVRRTQTAALVLLHAYLVVQALVPLRHWLYPGNVHWTEQGHRFSWHMMLRDKRVRSLTVSLTDPATGATRTIDPRAYLTDRQLGAMKSRPDMLRQFARHVADQEEARTGTRPEVRVRVLASLHGRPYQDLIDPNVDLAAQPAGLGAADWIVPLREE